MDQKQIPIDKAMEMQFIKIGQLTFQLDVVTLQIQELTKENERLQAIIDAMESRATETQ